MDSSFFTLHSSLFVYLAFPIEIEGFFYFLGCGCLVDHDFAYCREQGEIDDASSILFVVSHKGNELIVVVASEGEVRIVLTDEPYRLAHTFGREACLDAAEIKFAHQTIGNSMTMKDRLALQCPRLESMTEGVAKVESLADGTLVRVELYDILLDLYRVSHHLLQLLIVGSRELEIEKLSKVSIVGDESMLKHLSIARAQVVVVERF